MKCAYEAASGVDAHMVAHLLEQHRIDSRIDGEYLASGVGELPAAGLVRVMVEDRHHDRAREVIRKWEAESPAAEISVSKQSYAPAWFALGLVVGAALMSWIDHL